MTEQQLRATLTEAVAAHNRWQQRLGVSPALLAAGIPASLGLAGLLMQVPLLGQGLTLVGAWHACRWLTSREQAADLAGLGARLRLLVSEPTAPTLPDATALKELPAAARNGRAKTKTLKEVTTNG